ncbi:class I SAM-dependent methyltransferase [Formosa sp. PL04]|uniref:class I SAM-dependent methyltransferase n=1 Tax=Formosa sp. PL04 TaxID=3081755 RepID=UPI00298109A5|nr:class I SAM-dependent methyltransferase [Formosa sp. PL04]MDW5289598.1 class I SAM-dependent methyltransferase [Formosa sp. PL04]
MKPDHDYKTVNKATWNAKTEAHLTSDFYNVEGFLNGNSSLNSIELGLLGDVKGKKILHLQCHFGQDSLSLARLGSQVTGVDLSNVAIKNAERLANQLELNTTFICCDLYDLPNHLDDTFDVVYTSYGTIGWFPDLDKWAKLISKFLKPQGEFIFVEFHPVVWMFNDAFDKIEYSYFKSDAIIETETGTYADRSADIINKSITWNHSLGEVLTALLQNNLQLQSFEEFDYSPYDCFSNTVEMNSKQFRIAHLDSKLPMVYALKALKKQC